MDRGNSAHETRSERPSHGFIVRNAKRIRGITCFAIVIGLTAVSLAFGTGTGTLSALGIGPIASVCPLGSLEAILGSKVVSLHGMLCLAAAVIAILIFGKALCSWACPIPWIKSFFKPRGPKNGKEDHVARCGGCSHACEERRNSLPPIGGKRDGARIDGRHIVLAGTLASSALFGFPVFCLVCPVGLTFALIIGLWHLFQFNEATWGLLIYPVIILAEVLLLRKWCTSFCPISALVSLISNANRLFKPRVNENVCLRSNGVNCKTCIEVCPELLDPHSKSIPECSKCLKCVQACPAQAISMKVLPKSK